MPRPRALLWLAAISTGYLALCVAYNLVTPYRTGGLYVPSGVDLVSPDVAGRVSQTIPDIGAPDERQHVNYVRRLAEERAFPVFRVGDEEGYENHQPPLYYLLCVPVEMWSGGAEGFALRLFTSLIGLLAVWTVFATARRVTGGDAAALWTAGVTALLPSYLALSSSVSNDPLLVLWCTVGLLLCVRGEQDGWTARRTALCGAVCGLALLTKTSALALVAFCALAFLISQWRASRGRAVIGAGAVVALALVIASPWLARNWSLYGDPLGLRIFEEGFSNSPKAGDFIVAYGGFGYLFQWIGWWTLRSVFGVFGYMQLFLPAGVYVAGGALTALCLVGGARWTRGEPEEMRRRAAGLCWLLFALVFLAFLRFNMTYFQAQARYLLPALAPISLGFAVGWRSLFPERARTAAMIALLAALLAVNLLALSRLGPAFRALSHVMETADTPAPLLTTKLECAIS